MREAMKKTIAALVFIGMILMPGCSPAVYNEVVELQKLHTFYRTQVVPKSATESAKVVSLGDEIDKSFVKIVELTK
jgi:hypothetical protein